VVLSLAEGQIYLCPYIYQTGSGAHPASYPVGTADSYPRVKRPGREAEQSPPSSAEVKNTCSSASTPKYVFMVWCLVKHRDNFTFILPSVTSLCIARVSTNPVPLNCLRSMETHLRAALRTLYASGYSSDMSACDFYIIEPQS